MLIIDGSIGEGGGQILRSSLALSVLTGTPFRIENIRANRDKSGLRRQHRTAALAAARICGGVAQGAEIDSREMSFFPGKVAPGDFTFSVGSAGSTMLVLQTVLPPLLLAGGPSTIVLEGGTHNFGAPPFDFLQRVFLPLINRMGPRVEAALERPGFAPAGGGRAIVTVEPAKSLSPLHLLERGPIVRKTVTATVAGIPRAVAERELKTARDLTGWGAEAFVLNELPEAFGPGNLVTVEIASAHITELFTAFGQRGVPAEAVATQAVRSAQAYLDAAVPIGDCLADQLLLPLALARGGSYRTMKLTRHAETNIAVIQMFLDVHIHSTEEPGGTVLVKVEV